MTQIDQSALAGLRRWNYRLAGVFLLQAAAILLLSKHTATPVSATYLTTDTVQSVVAGHTVFAEASRQLHTVSIAGFVSLALCALGVMYGAAATFARARYETDLGKGSNSLRWIGYGAAQALLFIVVALLGGIQDITTLALVGVLGMFMCLLARATEQTTRVKGQTPWLTYGLSVAAGLIVWLVIGTALGHAHLYGDGHIPGYVYLLFAGLLISITKVLGILLLSLRRHGSWVNYLHVERMYMLSNFVVISLLSWFVFVEVLNP